MNRNDLSVFLNLLSLGILPVAAESCSSDGADSMPAGPETDPSAERYEL